MSDQVVASTAYEIGVVEVLNLQPLRLLTWMNELLEIVYQQRVLQAGPGNKRQVLCLAMPGDVLNICKPAWHEHLLHQEPRNVPKPCLIDRCEDYDSREQLVAARQELEEAWSRYLTHGVRDQRALEVQR